MKRIFIPFFIVLLYLSGNIYAQIPNSGFENWVNGEPVNWKTNNVPTVFTLITQSNEVHSGSSAIKGIVIDFNGIISPTIIGGTDGYGWTYTDRPGSFHGFYKFQSSQDDILTGDAVFIHNGSPIGAASLELGPAASYTEFSSDITWITADNPDTVYIVFLISNRGEVHLGSAFYLDDLFFSEATDVQRENNSLRNFELAQNFPNPFNPTTTIKYAIPKTVNVELRVFDILGREVKTLVNDIRNPGYYEVEFSAEGGSASGGNASQLASGVYFYRIKAGDFIQTKKMILLR